MDIGHFAAIVKQKQNLPWNELSFAHRHSFQVNVDQGLAFKYLIIKLGILR